MYYLAKLRFESEDDSGKTKKIREQYLVQASSVGEAEQKLMDRFGPLPAPVNDLFVTIQCRRLAISLGFEKMTLKEKTMRCFFINRPDSPYFESDTFKDLLGFTNTSMNNAHFKQVGKTFILIIKDIQGMEACFSTLHKMYAGIFGK